MRARICVFASGAALALMAAGVGLAAGQYRTTTAGQRVVIVGCSNSSLIAKAYDFASSRHDVLNAAQGTYDLSIWATNKAFTTPSMTGQSNTPFDTLLAMDGQPVAVWYPVCIGAKTFTGTTAQRQRAAWAAFQSFLALLRQRTQAPLWVTDTIGAQPSCIDDQELMTFVVDRAVQQGLAQRSSPDIPPASAPDANHCHFDPAASSNVGQAAAAFIDGTFR